MNKDIKIFDQVMYNDYPSLCLKTKQKTLDKVAYIFMVILSLGTVWLIRVLISVAIRKALKN